MKIKVIKNCYYVSEDLTCIDLVSEDQFQSSFSHLLVVGDVWENIDNEGNFSEQCFKCIEGKWLGEESDGWWNYEGNEYYFEVIEN